LKASGASHITQCPVGIGTTWHCGRAARASAQAALWNMTGLRVP
jgi:hypothetical protein